jgi:hypothetical protein
VKTDLCVIVTSIFPFKIILLLLGNATSLSGFISSIRLVAGTAPTIRGQVRLLGLGFRLSFAAF